MYCDFSIAVRSSVPVEEYLTALAREWDARHAGASPDFDTVYLGGGTPSKLGPDGVARLMELVRARAAVLPDAEVTLEANPEDVSVMAARAWREAGINRLSLGVQSFDPGLLAWMHRTHAPDDARRAIGQAREAGLENVSIDLIFAAPSRDRVWGRDIEAAVALELPHLSIYGLTVEPRTPLGRWVSRAAVAEAPEESFEAEFLNAHQALTSAGLEHYEVSNYGRAGAHSRHNWAYWHRRPYVGLGPSAHEFDGVARRWNVEAYSHWLGRATRDGQTTEGEEVIRSAETIAEQTYLGLRTVEGLALEREECEHVAPWVHAGWAVIDENRVRLTPTGWLRLDALAADLTHFRSRY